MTDKPKLVEMPGSLLDIAGNLEDMAKAIRAGEYENLQAVVVVTSQGSMDHTKVFSYGKCDHYRTHYLLLKAAERI